MNELIVRVDDLEFRAESRDAEPRVLDLEMARRLGYARPAKVRDLIRRLVREKILNDFEVFTTVGRTSPAGGRPAIECWLTESGAIKVAAKSDTTQATAILDQVIRVYREATRMLREPSRPLSGPAFDDAVARFCSGAVRIGEHPLLRRQMQRAIKWTAVRIGASQQKVAGEVRRRSKQSSEFDILVDRAEYIFDHLEAIACGRLLLAKSNSATESKQLRMFDA